MVGVNYLGPFYLNELLMDELIKSKGKLVIVASEAHTFVKTKPNIKECFYPDENKKGMVESFQVYAISKLLNVYNANSIHKKYHEKGVCINSLHPGAINRYTKNS
jgi:NAD(P)-dependent dehydrogenase (short-subunit alcohol dehydrogenase family)